MKLGLSTYALTWSFGIPGYAPKKVITLTEFLELAARLGYQGVQIADNAPLLQLTAEERQSLWKQADRLGLYVEIGARGLTEENVERHIAIAREVGSPFIRFVIDGPGFEPSLEAMPAILEAATEKCARHDIILAIENHDRFQAHQFASWFDAVDSPHLGLCLDSVNSYGCGEGFRETIDTLLPYTVNFHLKDFSVRRQDHMLGFLIEGTPAGEGFLPLESILNRLEANGKCLSVAVEHWPSPEDTVDATVEKEKRWCEQSIRNLKPLFPKISLNQEVRK